MKEKELLRIVKEAGWEILRQNGSHVAVISPEGDRRTIYIRGNSKDAASYKTQLKNLGIEFRHNKNTPTQEEPPNKLTALSTSFGIKDVQRELTLLNPVENPIRTKYFNEILVEMDS